MNANSRTPVGAERFLAAAGKLAAKFSWRARKFEREGEVVLVALTETDSFFDRFVWIYDTERSAVRCMLASKEVVPLKRLPAILEACARINEGLAFGCLEYSFSQRILVFRDSSGLHWEHLDEIVTSTTSRVLSLGRRYAPAIQATIRGAKPDEAVAAADVSK